MGRDRRARPSGIGYNFYCMIRDKADALAFLKDLEGAIAKGALKGTAMEREICSGRQKERN